jgi:hypothetical protein
MGFMSQLFSIQELSQMDEKEFEMLRDAIQRQLRTNPKVKAAVKKSVTPLMKALRARRARRRG